MGYEIWDRDAAILLEDFDTQEKALAYLRELVSTLAAQGVAQTLDRMQLVRVTDAGGRTEVIMSGVGLFPLMFADVQRSDAEVTGAS